MSIIQINNLSFTYEGSFDPVFENVSFVRYARQADAMPA